MEIFQLIAIGLLTGFISSFFGIGGGVVIVPSLFLIYPKLPYITVISCSFGVIFLNSILNTYNFRKLNLSLPFSFLKPFIISIIPGVLLGSYLVTLFPIEITKKIFASFLLLLVIKNVFVRKQQGKQEAILDGKFFFKLISGFFTGLIASMTGVGGGAILVPIFLLIYKIPAKLISPGSNAVMIFLTIVAIVRQSFSPVGESIIFEKFQWGHLNIAVVLLIFFGAIITSKLGVKVNDICSDSLKKNIFSFLLFLLSIRLFLS